MKNYDVEEIQVSEIHLAPYQRKTKASRVKRMERQYDANAFDPLMVSLRDGVYWSVDGGHRKALAESLGWDKVPCRVLTGLDYRQEAQLYNLRNDRGSDAPLTPYETFRGLVEARDGKALIVNLGLLDAGLNHPSDIGCYKTMFKVAEHGYAEFTLSARITEKAYDQIGLTRVPAWLFVAIAEIVHADSALDALRLVRAIVENYQAIAGEKAVNAETPNRGARKGAEIILTYYNRNLGTHRIVLK
jgi:hypothetical protein